MHTTPTTTKAAHMPITVTCSDNEIRHTEFATMAEAEHWADWGHFCLKPHTFTETTSSAMEG